MQCDIVVFEKEFNLLWAEINSAFWNFVVYPDVVIKRGCTTWAYRDVPITYKVHDFLKSITTSARVATMNFPDYSYMKLVHVPVQLFRIKLFPYCYTLMYTRSIDMAFFFLFPFYKHTVKSRYYSPNRSLKLIWLESKVSCWLLGSRRGDISTDHLEEPYEENTDSFLFKSLS